ncbi:MAG: BatD family protein, partial [Bacteroidota bacterium]|nr:BatD family protein [Bacteroidota bacterium]
FEVKTIVNRDFFNRGKSKTLKSNSLKLKVRALPPNPPISFTGQIGRNYKLNVDVRKTLLKVDDPLDIHIEISGNGNLKQLDMPKLSLPQDLEKYPEETKSNIKVSENGIYGKKKLHQLVIPRFHGEYKIPTISFSYFDLNSGKYKTLKHPETIITVEKTNKSSASNTINFEKPQQDEVVTINDNIRHIKTETELFDFSSPIFGTAYYWGLLASSPLILLLFLVFFSNKEKFTNSEKTLLKQINKQTQIQLTKAEVNFISNSLDQFYKEIYSLWISLISKKYSIDMAELNRSSIYQVLEKNKVNPDIIRSIDEILTKCEMAQYSPLSSDDADICLSKTKELVQNLKDNA